jgi:hypothetical protein
MTSTGRTINEERLRKTTEDGKICHAHGFAE